jgi:hypothetical protein
MRNKGVPVCRQHCHHGSRESRDPRTSPLQISGRLDYILNELPDGRSHIIKRGEQMRAWLSVLPSTINMT